MCGISGFYDITQQQSIESLSNIVEMMSNTLIHRGPDGSDIWVNAAEGIALGHRRLSIVDLSPNGSQPMHSANERYVITFNGEIYNFKLLRQELEKKGHIFRGYSDTEIMLSAIVEWGLTDAVQRFVGAFAFALWDRKKRVLQLVRDRLGEKPLYYGWMGNSFLFGSELKALRVHPEFKSEINRDVLPLYMRHNCIPAPYSIYKNVFKLMPGTILTISQDGRRNVNTNVYWNAKDIAENGIKNFFTGTDQEAVGKLDSILRDAVEKQMVADVSLGVFLSGGIDSSTIAALMQSQSNSPVKTFTIGFYESGYNEAEQAKTVAKYLGTDHTELYITPREAIDVISKLPLLYDEPFSDSSQIPTFLVAKLAKEQVTVSLSGDGADELFGGYNRYIWVKSIWDKIWWMPQSIRKNIATVLKALPLSGWESCLASLSPIISKKFMLRTIDDKIHKLAGIMDKNSPDAIYRGLVSHWESDDNIFSAHNPLQTALTDKSQWANLDDFTQRMMYFDMITYLPDDILVKVDRACLGMSLESRVPFLDHRVVEFAWQLPMSMKIRHGEGKWLLRQVLYQYVPQKLVDRPKTGFGIPIDSWLRGPLRNWAEDLLSESRLKSQGFLNVIPIRKKWEEHLSGKYNWQYQLWDVLMFQAWLENNG
jgi:asparagine synthase (glutamine-hydrolysing)